MSAGTLQIGRPSRQDRRRHPRLGALESERLGHLAPDVVDACTKPASSAMLVPDELGGLGLTIPESIEIIERVAALDASTGWTLAILADGPIFARHLSPEAFADDLQRPAVSSRAR